MGTVLAVRDDRLSLRLPRENKRKIEQAARLSGQSLTDFVVGVLTERAVQVISEHTAWTLSNEAFDALVAAVANPPEPSAALIDLFRGE
ncbi:MAG: DUF1778 domain-containing protein [Armatimonadetes bacterium]|nr:DUF1778 domain-containing protein [Armatimonadota bacterium]